MVGMERCACGHWDESHRSGSCRGWLADHRGVAVERCACASFAAASDAERLAIELANAAAGI